MGYYFDPPNELPRIARPIHIARPMHGGSYAELQAQLKDGERLFGHYDRFVFQNAVWLFSEEEMEEFESQVRQGQIMRLGFYAMPDDVFEERMPGAATK